MGVLLVLFFLGLVAVAAAGTWVYAADSGPSWLRPVAWGRLLAERTGVVAAGLVIALAGTQAVFLLGVPIGWAATKLEKPVDHPVFNFIYPRVHENAFTDVMKVLTKMGNIFEIRIECVIGAVLLGLLWRRYFYLPAAIILSTFILEKFMQKGLAKIIDRGHPVTTLGTYPSGGCARLLSIGGIMVFLALLALPAVSRRVKITTWTVFAVLVWCEAFSRMYLSKHWLTDAIGGVILGVLLLLAVVSATAALTSKIAPEFTGTDTLSMRHQVGTPAEEPEPATPAS